MIHLASYAAFYSCCAVVLLVVDKAAGRERLVDCNKYVKMSGEASVSQNSDIVSDVIPYIQIVDVLYTLSSFSALAVRYH